MINSNAAVIAAHICNLLPEVKSGSLTFFGDWFGRPYDNQHTVVTAYDEEDRLVAIFNGGEKLTVWNPGRFLIEKRAFIIYDASRVLWEWYSYGLPRSSDNLCYLDYESLGDRVEFRTNFAYAVAQTDPFLPAVEIHSA